ALVGLVRCDDEIVEAVDQTQRVDDLRAVRVAAIREREMTLGLVDLVLAQEVDAELRVRGIQIGLELDGLTKQLDRFAIAPRDHVEMRLRLVDLTVRRVVCERALDPRAFRLPVQEIERGVERIDLERRKALRL